MKKTKLSVAVAGLALTFSTLVVPQAVAVDSPADTSSTQVSVSETDIDDLLSYESTNGTTVVPGQTITIQPDRYDDRLPLLNVWTVDRGIYTQWDLDLDTETGAVTITAPQAPEEQFGSNTADYGEHEFRVRTNEEREVYFTLEFQDGELPPEPDVSEIDVAELLSYESTNGTTVVPGQTITIQPDRYDDRLPLLNVYPTDNSVNNQWRGSVDRDTGAVTITAPQAPEDQFGSNTADYGEYEFRVRTNDSREVYFTLNFEEAPEDIGAIDIAELLSYESTNGTTVAPGQTITIQPDRYDDRLPLLNVWTVNPDTYLQWNLDLNTETGAVTITAPQAPEDQIGTNTADYGEHEFRVRTNEEREVYFTLEFQEEKVEDPEEEPNGSSGSPLDNLRDLVSNLGGYLARLIETLISFFR